MKGKKLTEKQERFCLEYVRTMNASAAYRLAYDTSKMKMATVNNNAYKLLQINDIKTRIAELKKDIEGTLGFNKLTILQELREVKNRCCQPEPVYEWVMNETTKKMEKVHKMTDDGQYVWQFDSAGANSALDKIMKAMGYFKTDDDGQDLGAKIILNTNINV